MTDQQILIAGNKLATELSALLENNSLHITMGDYARGRLSHSNYLEEQLRSANSALQEWEDLAAQSENNSHLCRHGKRLSQCEKCIEEIPAFMTRQDLP